MKRDTLGTLRARLEIVKKAHAELWNEKEQLRRRAEVAEAALRAVQWGNAEIYSYDGQCGVRHECPECGRTEKTGHATDCCVGIALARVVVEGQESTNAKR